MKCPRCAHLNPTAVKFCNECGQMMGVVCSNCDTVNLPESKFCSQCGSDALSEQVETEQGALSESPTGKPGTNDA